MGKLRVIQLFLCVCCVAIFASKYSEPNKDVKNSKITDEAPFRMNKINLFWEKARKVSDITTT